MVDDVILAYLAGIMDADGYISIQRTFSNPKYPLSYSYCEWVGCGQISQEAISLFHNIWGGSLILRKPQKSGHRPLYYWLVTNKKAARVVTDLYPFLRVKRDQADLIIQLRKSKNLPKVETHVKGKSLKPEVQSFREELWFNIRQKHAGTHSQPRMIRKS